MIKYCFNCKEMKDFNNLNDFDCNRCENCLSLPYSQEDYFNKLYLDKLSSVIIELNELLNEGNPVILNRKLSLIIDKLNNVFCGDNTIKTNERRVLA